MRRKCVQSYNVPHGYGQPLPVSLPACRRCGCEPVSQDDEIMCKCQQCQHFSGADAQKQWLDMVHDRDRGARW